MDPAIYEQLGSFYLGKIEGQEPAEPLLLESRDLTTHAVILGMTGSGKTGLGVSLLEEAAIDGVPALILDPKGDLANLALRFPDLTPSDFRPWIDPAEATRAGQDLDQFAAATATRWRAGLAAWGQGADRIQRLQRASDVQVYTPGGMAGRPLAVLRSFSAPAAAVLADFEALQLRIGGAVGGLLSLLGIEADPFTSREYLLLANLLQHAWTAGRDLDLAGLLREVQAPPFQSLGLMDLETVFPARDRLGFAMRLNGLLAAPGFAAWTRGEPLEIDRLLTAPDGRPRLAVLSLAHLSDAERMFFVTTLLSELVSWMRAQPGTASLRALLYMDEVFGYLPPVANPPSKTPLLTLLKQARAYGLGVVLATQNPVDLDYKALSNMGTWFLGRLQTERDLERVLDGLEAASGGGGPRFERAALSRLLAGLGRRRFLLRSAHQDQPEVFETRFVLSYLRGPMTPEELRRLPADAAAPPSPPRATATPVGGAEATRPVLPAGVPEAFLPVTGSAVDAHRVCYRPALLGEAELHYVAPRQGIDHWRTLRLLAVVDERIDAHVWSGARELEGDPPGLASTPLEGARFDGLPPELAREKTYATLAKDLAAHLFREGELPLRTTRSPALTGEPGESEAAFRSRLRAACRELRDREVEHLRGRHAPRMEKLKERIRRAKEKVAVEQDQLKQKKQDATLRTGSTLLGALFGRSLFSQSNLSRATSTVRSAGRIEKETRDVARAEDRVEELEAAMAELGEELRTAFEELAAATAPEAIEVTSTSLKPRKGDIRIGGVRLVWMPWLEERPGERTPGFQL